MKTTTLSVFLVAALAGVAAADPAKGLLPVQLRCEFVEDPLGVDVVQPRLFWKFDGGRLLNWNEVGGAARAQRQSAYQVLVATSVGRLDQEKADLWDSGKVNSDETIHILYGGQPLKSSQKVFWKVRYHSRGYG